MIMILRCLLCVFVLVHDDDYYRENVDGDHPELCWLSFMIMIQHFLLYLSLLGLHNFANSITTACWHLDDDNACSDGNDDDDDDNDDWASYLCGMCGQNENEDNDDDEDDVGVGDKDEDDDDGNDGDGDDDNVWFLLMWDVWTDSIAMRHERHTALSHKYQQWSSSSSSLIVGNGHCSGDAGYDEDEEDI